MSANIGALNAFAALQTAAFDKSIDKMRGKLKGLQGTFASVGSKMSSIGQGMSLGVTAPFVALMAKAIPAAKESREAIGQVNAALASMGPVAGRTSEQLQAAAKSLQRISTFDDDEVLQKVTAHMLTFGNVAGAQFDRAQVAAVNLASRMGGDLQSATLMIGKALNSPAEGISKLSRAGIQFTEQQKAQIEAMTKAGDAAGAQKIMLAELERQFGGSAEAMRAADPAAALTNTWNDFQETVGEIALKVLPPLTTALQGLVERFNTLSPATQAFAVGAAAIAAALGPVMMVLGPIVTTFGKLIPLAISLGKALTLLAMNPVGATIMAIAAAVGAVYLAWKNWDKITAIAAQVYQGVKNWIGDKLGKIIDWAAAKVRSFAAPFLWVYDKVVGHSYIPDLVDGIAHHIARLQSVMVQPAQTAAEKTAVAFERLKSVLERLFPEEALHNKYLAELKQLEADAAAAKLPVDQLAEAVRRLRREYTDAAGLTVDGPSFANAEAPATNDDPDFSSYLPKGGGPGRLVTLLDQLAPALQRIGDLGGRAFGRIADGIVNGVIPAIKAMKDKTMEAGEKLAAIGDAITTIFTSIFGRKWGGIIGSIASIGMAALGGGGGLNPGKLGDFFRGIKVPKLAHGGSFQIGGMGGIDSNLLSINGSAVARVSRGERVDVTPANDRGPNGNVTVVVNAKDAVLTHQVRQWVAEGMEQAAIAGAYGGEARAIRRLRRPTL